jgi:O-antigen ligase
VPIATANAHNLILGIGTAALETPQVSSTAPVKAVVARVPQAYDGSLHSQYVTTLVEQGLIGLTALVVFLVAALSRAARAAWANRDAIFAAVAGSLVSFAIAMSVGTDLLHGPSFAMLMVASGIAAGASVRRRPA